MSQGEAQGLLSEDEIKDFLQKTFEISVDRDALIKPSCNFVFDIYSRFLDDIYGLKWRTSKKNSYDNQESFIKAFMVGRMNYTISKYNVGTTFQMKDLLRPTRKRTVLFLNFLIFVKSQLEELNTQWQLMKVEWSEKKAEYDKLQEQLRYMRIARDDLALKKSSIKPIDEIVRNRDQLRATFEDSQREATELHEKAKALKNEIERRSKLLAEKQAIVTRKNEEFGEARNRLDLLDSNRDVRERISGLTKSIQIQRNTIKEIKDDSSKTKVKLEALQRAMNSCSSNTHNTSKRVDITNRLIDRYKREEQAREERYEKAIAEETRLNKEEASRKDLLGQLENDKKKKFIQLSSKRERALKDLNVKNAALKELTQFSPESEEIRDKIESIKRERAEILKTQQSIRDQCLAQADKANKQLENLLRRYEESNRKSEPNVKAIDEFNSRLEAILGKPKEVELPGNRTYIKETRSD